MVSKSTPACNLYRLLLDSPTAVSPATPSSRKRLDFIRITFADVDAHTSTYRSEQASATVFRHRVSPSGIEFTETIVTVGGRTVSGHIVGVGRAIVQDSRNEIIRKSGSYVRPIP